MEVFMRFKLFVTIFTMLAILPVKGSSVKQNSSWSDFCADLASVKDSLLKKLEETTPSIPEVSNPLSNINGADVVIPAAVGWTGFGLWVKGFKFKNPITSTKNIFKVSPEAKYSDLARSVLNNKAYGLRLGLKNGAKVSLAAYLTGFAWHSLINSDKK
jgi:hypothetical protein